MHASRPPRICCAKRGYARLRLAPLSLSWVVLNGGRLLPDARSMNLVLQSLRVTELSTDINQLFTGNDDTSAQSIDQNLANTALAMAAIQAVKFSATLT